MSLASIVSNPASSTTSTTSAVAASLQAKAETSHVNAAAHKALDAGSSTKRVSLREMFLQACKSGNIDKVRELLRVYPQFARCTNDDGESVLTLVCLATEAGVSEEARDTMIQLLLEHKADPNTCLAAGGSPLVLVLAKMREFSAVKLFLAFKADPQRTNRFGDSLRKYALVQEDVELVALILGTSESNAQKYISEFGPRGGRNRLAQIHGIKVSELPRGALELGFNETLTIPIAKKALQGKQASLESALDKALAAKEEDAEKIAKEMRQGNLVKLCLGFPGHTIYLVVKRVGKDTILLVVNTGAALPENGRTITAWRVDPQRLTSEFIQKLFEIRAGGTQEEAAQFYYEDLPQWLEGESTALTKRVEALSTSKQKMGNCAWKAVEAAVRGAHALEQAAAGNGRWVEEALAVSKKMAANARIDVAKEYFDAHKELQGSPLFSLAHAKIACKKTRRRAEKIPELTKREAYRYVCRQEEALDKFIRRQEEALDNFVRRQEDALDAARRLSESLTKFTGLSYAELGQWIFHPHTIKPVRR